MTISATSQSAIQTIRAKAVNKNIVFVSGTFNIVHPGHLRLLRFAAECGDFLVVGVLSDRLASGPQLQETMRLDGVDAISLVSHTFSIYRDLHCWEMSINWTPNGYASGLYLRINVKSPSLKDLKFEQRGGTFSRPSLFDR